VSTRPAHVSTAGQLEGFSLSPKGERALFVARGDIFTAPVERGYTRMAWGLARTVGDEALTMAIAGPELG